MNKKVSDGQRTAEVDNGANVHFTVGSDGPLGVTRSYSSFEQAAQEAGDRWIYGGIHYPFDNTAGQTLGAAVGQYVDQHTLR